MTMYNFFGRMFLTQLDITLYVNDTTFDVGYN